jgi:hypothetical protein
MRTFQSTSLSEPKKGERIPEGTLGYFRSRNKHRIYSLVVSEFKASGITQIELARRLGKGTDLICRLLRSPGNWTLDTLSDLLFAISGAEAALDIEYPLRSIKQPPKISVKMEPTDSVLEWPLPKAA